VAECAGLENDSSRATAPPPDFPPPPLKMNILGGIRLFLRGFSGEDNGDAANASPGESGTEKGIENARPCLQSPKAGQRPIVAPTRSRAGCRGVETGRRRRSASPARNAPVQRRPHQRSREGSVPARGVKRCDGSGHNQSHQQGPGGVLRHQVGYSAAMYCIGSVVALIVWFLMDVFILSSHEPKWSPMRRLGRWWDKRFPPTDERRPQGFDVKLRDPPEGDE
jgi:hypothetical protein